MDSICSNYTCVYNHIDDDHTSNVILRTCMHNRDMIEKINYEIIIILSQLIVLKVKQGSITEAKFKT